MKALVKFSNKFNGTEVNVITKLVKIADDWYTFMYYNLSPYQHSKIARKFGRRGRFYTHVEIIKVYGIKQSDLEIKGKEVIIKNYSK